MSNWQTWSDEMNLICSLTWSPNSQYLLSTTDSSLQPQHESIKKSFVYLNDLKIIIIPWQREFSNDLCFFGCCFCCCCCYRQIQIFVLMIKKNKLTICNTQTHDSLHTSDSEFQNTGVFRIYLLNIIYIFIIIVTFRANELDEAT